MKKTYITPQTDIDNITPKGSLLLVIDTSNQEGLEVGVHMDNLIDDGSNNNALNIWNDEAEEEYKALWW